MTLKKTIKQIARDFDKFTAQAGGIQLRPYQLEPGRAIVDSVIHNRGLSFVLMMSRQAGKDELIANLLAYLSNLFSHRDVSIVVANPTYKPQTINAIMRYEKRLTSNLITRLFWTKRADYMRLVGQATTSFLSAEPNASVVGATASMLLIVNEAQDVEIPVYDKKFAPMAASTNATRIFAGTAWTSKTLLAREIRAAREAEKVDGIRRVFIYDADAVRKDAPAYGAFVDGEVTRHGRQHPLIKTQYFCEEIDALTGMFTAARRALMQGDQPAQDAPLPRHTYALTVDVGGQDEAMLSLDGMGNPGRDYVTVNIIDIDLSQLATLQSPIYRVVQRHAWQGQNHVTIYGKIAALVDRWKAQYIVLDAGGVGEGLWGMLYKRYPTRTIAAKFTQQYKSELGYLYIGIIETGRFRDCAPSPVVDEQYAYCESEVLIGPQKTLRWGVPDGTRSTSTGDLVHDDHITADALTAELDRLPWYAPSETAVIEQADVLEQMDYAY